MGIILVIGIVVVLCLLNSIACFAGRIDSHVPAQPPSTTDTAIKVMLCVLSAMILGVTFVALLPH
jgi:hypothetical protein